VPLIIENFINIISFAKIIKKIIMAKRKCKLLIYNNFIAGDKPAVEIMFFLHTWPGLKGLIRIKFQGTGNIYWRAGRDITAL